MMFLLVLVTIIAGQIDTTMIKKYQNIDECEIEKRRIKAEFLQAYPNDNSWAFVCIPAPIKSI